MDENLTPIEQALGACKRGFAAVVFFSLFINVLMLTAPLYMLQIFDRVIVTRSEETLLYLSLIAIFALVLLASLEVVRTYILIRLSVWLERFLSGKVFESEITASLKGRGGSSVECLRDLNRVRVFLTGSSIFAILDAPFMPVFLACIFIMHPSLGWLSLTGALVLFVFAVLNQIFTRNPISQANTVASKSLNDAQSAVRNGQVIRAMGMTADLVDRWNSTNNQSLLLQARGSLRSGIITATSKSWRQILQVGILGLGAWLLLAGEISSGMMIAASILMARALSPVEQAIGSFQLTLSARESYKRVKELLAENPPNQEQLNLPPPNDSLSVESVTYLYTNSAEPTLRNISFSLAAGESLGIIGPTAAGKSTLASLLVGVKKPQQGNVRIDGADIFDWPAKELGRYIGYLPQNIELFSGTVSENIARMGPINEEAVVKAAKLAGVHELILKFDKGYETEIGDAGAILSGGQRQRIGLARALYGEPFLLVLDEPNSSLDNEGEEALIQAISFLKKNGVIVIVIAHRPNIIRILDKVLILRGGSVNAFGTPDEVLPSTLAQPPQKEPRPRGVREV